MRSRLNLVTGQPDARASVPVGGLDFEQPLLAVVWRKGSDVVTPMVLAAIRGPIHLLGQVAPAGLTQPVVLELEHHLLASAPQGAVVFVSGCRIVLAN
jgi:hypothetical protein